MSDAVPTVIARSAAICGSSVSAARTMPWLAKLAVARKAMARLGERVSILTLSLQGEGRIAKSMGAFVERPSTFSGSAAAFQGRVTWDLSWR